MLDQVTDTDTRVLLVEDDQNIVDLIRSNLLVRGFQVDVSRTGEDVMRLAEDGTPDVVLLDLMLPQADGFELCRVLREQSTVGIIVISARGGEGDKVRALNLGADDYMTKPFGIEELLARITATLRRTRPAAAVIMPEAPGVVEAGDVVVDLDARRVTKAGERVHLTPTELALLRELALNPRVLLGHAHLLRRVWGPGYETETEYLRVYVRRLRAKLDSPDAPTLIVTEPRLGYRFEPPPAAPPTPAPP
ncbi:MAG TPA: response regulator transcription factor [Acidimicrobiales bacterium]|nr:response regulator transcription factor [Acidimicrobiales bacterium]